MLDDGKKKQTLFMAISFLVGVAFGFGGYWLILDGGAGGKFFVGSILTPTQETENSKNDAQEENSSKEVLVLATKEVFPIAIGNNFLVVSPQPAGSTVIMSMISLEMDGWIAIHEDVGDGTPGSILGARRFNTGRYFGEPIELLRNTQEGEVYFVMLHGDDGDGEFNHEVEIALKDPTGNFIQEKFLATSSGSIE